MLLETVASVDYDIGLLHRTLEKLGEHRALVLLGGYMERMDYVSGFNMLWITTLLLLRLENSADTSMANATANLECTRIANHILNVACTLGDTGMVSPLLWLFEWREAFWEWYEWSCGIRLHCWLVHVLVTGSFLLDDGAGFGALAASSGMQELLDLSTGLMGAIQVSRAGGVAVVAHAQSWSLSLSGVLVRGAGHCLDLRLVDVELYQGMIAYTGIHGDCAVRVTLRIHEMLASHSLAGTTAVGVQHDRGALYHSIETLVVPFVHLKSAVQCTSSVCAVEVPKGIGVLACVLATSAWAWRFAYRSVGTGCIAAVAQATGFLYLCDVVVLVGTIDIVLGEVDR